MNIERNIERLRRLDGDTFVQNLIAQANSRYILLNTQENRENFPRYTIVDSSLDILALYYLEIGCSFAENRDFENARESLEKGASILEHSNASETNRSELSIYYCLISALSYYVGFQYSKAFILINKIKSNTVIAGLITLFLQRNFQELSSEVERLVVGETDLRSKVSQEEDDIETAAGIYEVVIAKSLDWFVRYLQTGDVSFLDSAKTNLQLIKEIAELKSEPSIWWVIRLLLLISDGFTESSLWNSLSTHFALESEIMRKYIKSLVYQSPRGIFELFITQRKSLTKVLNLENKGCVVTIPTSSGKTRIAEIAIIDCINRDSANKVLYIAPFRSLAFEIENSLEKILSKVDLTLSHLYGGSLYSRLDERIIDEANIIIATPEKAKAILRGDRSVADQIKLVIIDEGHLLGADKRLIVNEIFYEELRYFIENNGGRFLILSAVLPNPEDLALWLTKSSDTIYKDTWRPSDERLGILDWNGQQVNLNWINNDTERPSFNNRFIIKEQLPLKVGQRKTRYFPGDKNEAVASTTYKLRVFGTALIFVGLKKSVFKMAEAYLKCLGNDPDDFNWSSPSDWKTYELSCIETYGENNNWLLYARKGILCHHGSLHVDVRLPLERLMRNAKPLVIISTSTLGQGVNLGVSTVVFSSIYQAGELITARDFWNIAGRAGRAFIDNEAKILIALDKSNNSTYADRRRISWENQKALEYFDKERIDIASSGILALVKALKRVTNNGNLEFDVLLQLITENKIEEIGENAKQIDEILDWIDDSLLSLHDLNVKLENEIDFGWVESFFRSSLAYIQIKEKSSISGENFISFIRARLGGIISRVGNDRLKWKSIIRSGIPMTSDLFLENKMPEIIIIVGSHVNDDRIYGGKIGLILKMVDIIREMQILHENIEALSSKDFDVIMVKWMNGDALSSFITLERAEDIITDLFSYKLPWIFNGISQKLKTLNLNNKAEIMEEISMLIEIGLPTLQAVKIYQAGIRSRVHAKEMSSLFEDELWDKSSREYKLEIMSNREKYKSQVSTQCREWIDLLYQMNSTKSIAIDAVRDFKYGEVHKKTTILIAKEINGKQHLLSPNYNFIEDISGSDIDFSSVNNISGVSFCYDPSDNYWKMIVDNPYIVLN